MQIYGALALLFIFSVPRKQTIFDVSCRNQSRPSSVKKRLKGSYNDRNTREQILHRYLPINGVRYIRLEISEKNEKTVGTTLLSILLTLLKKLETKNHYDKKHALLY